MTHANLEPPTLSEVIRTLEELKKDVQNVAGRVVSVDTYISDKAVWDGKVTDLKLSISELKLEFMAHEKNAVRAEREQAAQKRKTNWSYAAIALSAFLAIYLGPFLRIPFEQTIYP